MVTYRRDGLKVLIRKNNTVEIRATNNRDLVIKYFCIFAMSITISINQERA